MPIYEYETIPQNRNEEPERFEVRQGMNDAPLRVHPETGAPVRRVFSVFGVVGSSVSVSAPSSSSSHGAGCGCCGTGGMCGLD